jgi:hypothetical protein
MMMWTAFTSWWGNNRYAQWATWLFLAFIGWKTVKHNIKEAAKKAERQANAQRNAEEYARTVQTSSQVKEEIHAKVDAAREAAAVLPAYPDADSLREQNPRVAAIVFGDRPRDGG